MIKLSLPAKFALLSFVITLLGVIGVAFMAYLESDELLQQEAVKGLSMRMEKELISMEYQADLIRRDVDFLAQSDAVKRLANQLSVHAEPALGQTVQPNRTDLNQVEILFATVLQQREMYYQVRLIGLADAGREVVRVAHLEQGITVIAPAQLQQKGKRDYFTNSLQLEDGEFLFSEITLNREHGKITLPPQAMLRVSTAIYNDAGVLCGILLINVNFNVLMDSLQNKQNRSHFFVANAGGDYLIHADQSKAMAFEYQRQARLQDDYQLHEKNLKSTFQYDETVIQEYVFDDQGVVLLLGHVYLDYEHEGRSLQVGAVVELNQLRQKSVELLDRMLLLTLLLSLALGFITYWVSTYLTRPIRSMIAAAVKIGDGDERVSIPSNAHDEIGALGAALQQMLLHLAEQREKTEVLNAELEAKVSQRTAELARLAAALEGQNADLEQAVLDAESAATAKSQFLATMSHEIRTPLNGVLGLTELLLTTELSASQRANLKTVQGSGEALLAILNDILDFSKMEAGLMELQVDEFNPNLIIEHVAKLFSGRVNKDEAKLELIARGIPHVSHLLMGDAGRLQQVMMNLLSNAAKFTSQGDITIAADVIEESDVSVRVRFLVRDTGNGISDKDQAELFEEFTQADGTDTRKHGGTGLGLAIVKRLVTLMGGEIGVESEVGVGSCFFFELDMRKASEVKDKPQDYQAHFSQWRALVVDDNLTNQAMLHDVLIAWGVHCDVSDDAEIGLQSLQQTASTELAYDMVLIDQQMQGMDGMALARLIKENTQLSDLKVIMTTSLDMTFDADVREKYGLDGFIRKPVYVYSLFETVLAVMGVRQRKAVYRASVQVRQRSERILLAEDNAVNQQVAVGMLQHQGFEHVDVANDGLEALQLFGQHTYDLILMDIQMPELDGIAATCEIRKLEQYSDAAPIPIIALTAHALDEDKQRTQDAGMSGHLTKPLTGQSLQEMMAIWLPAQAVDDHATDDQAADVQTTDDQPTGVENELEDSVIDALALRQLRADMGFGIGMILDTYVEELPKQVESIIAAVAADDSDAVRRNGHRLKGSSRSVTAISLGEMCYQFEQLGQQHDMAAAAVLTDQFKQLAEQVEQAFKASWLDDIR